MKIQVLIPSAFVALVFLLSSVSHAATIGYWRFEGDSINTANPGTGNLTATGTGVTTTALAGSGATSDFFNPVPLTSAANTQTATGFTGNVNKGFSSDDFLDLSGNNAFTIEALFSSSNVSSGSNQTLAGQWKASNGYRSFLFQVQNGGQMGLYVSGNGIAAETYITTTADLKAANNRDYYAAATFSASGVTLFLQDLTDPEGSLATETFSTPLMNVQNSNAKFTIGGYDSSFQNPFRGDIDEVRLSDVVLSQSELLVIPEPSSLVLLGMGVLAGMAFTRKSRRRRG